MYDSFLPPPSLSVWLVLLVLEISADLTRGGFAAGSSFSLMREMEPFSTCIRVCVWGGCTCVYPCARRGSVGVFMYVVLPDCLCEILCVYLSQRVFVCSCGVCFWAFMCESFMLGLSTDCFKFSFPFLLWKQGNWTLCAAAEHNISFSYCV